MSTEKNTPTITQAHCSAGRDIIQTNHIGVSEERLESIISRLMDEMEAQRVAYENIIANLQKQIERYEKQGQE